ncbi:hypothetical protein C241_25691 [Bradyrhizobium lupini HPC(L)]|uniref:Uncharacterized protein n=1 Tax=Bradyrhizobium lupini HPC(L) TaxID=1229491 RepID=A0ABN0HFK2_RHILU|nr:hypothetical protein C241_25691 [Bradyrhizobium lupini HPC(L)]
MARYAAFVPVSGRLAGLSCSENPLAGRESGSGLLLPSPAGKKSPGETKGSGTACLTLSEHCDIPPPNVRVWRNW